MSNLNLGDKALDFNLPATDGGTCSLASFQDKKALAVIFSCVHCPYVLAWDDRMIELGRQYQGDGVAVVLICANDAVSHPADSFENMTKHALQKQYPFPFLHDESQEVAKAYGAERTPEVFLFDSERKLVYHGAIDDNYEYPEQVKVRFLREAVEAVLAGDTVPTEQTPPVGCTIKWK